MTPRSCRGPFVPAALSEVDTVLSDGFDVTICLRDGDVLVGGVVERSDDRILFRPWGAPSRWLALQDVRRASAVGSHSWADRREASRRQRAGLSAQGTPESPWPLPTHDDSG